MNPYQGEYRCQNLVLIGGRYTCFTPLLINYEENTMEISIVMYIGYLVIISITLDNFKSDFLLEHGFFGEARWYVQKLCLIWFPHNWKMAAKHGCRPIFQLTPQYVVIISNTPSRVWTITPSNGGGTVWVWWGRGPNVQELIGDFEIIV